MQLLDAVLLVWFGVMLGIFLAGIFTSAKRADEQSERFFENLRRSDDQ